MPHADDTAADARIAGLGRHDLYEACVQSPEDGVPLLRAIHGGDPRVLGEDFAGTAALSRAWVRSVPDGTAIAVDHDEAVLAEARARAAAAGVPADRLRLRAGNAVDPPPPGEPAPDVVYAGNFSIGELGDRTELLDYLRGVAGRLGPGGVFACDVYGGESAYMIGSAERPEPGPDGGTIVYTWEQREADPLTGRVVNALHFEVLDAEDASLGTMADAFVYRWRLWGVPELRDAMRDAGFRSTEVHARVPEAVDEADVAYVRPIEDPAELEDSFDVLIVGRLGP